jgi:hypothetical protein
MLFTIFSLQGTLSMIPSPLFFVRARRIVALGLSLTAGLIGLSLSTGAAAATKYDAKALERGMKEAPAVVATANLPCTVKEAAYIGAAKVKGEDGKEVSGQTYEVACTSGQGFVITKLADGKAGLTFNCNQAEVYNKARKEISTCQLPGNAINYTWLTPIVQKVKPACEVSKARWLGSIPTSKITRYEVACASTTGGIFDVPDHDSPNQSDLAYHSCLQVIGTNSQCEFVTKEEAIKSMAPQIAKASASCTVNNLRYAGASEDASYYEVGCANQAGFILVTTKSDEFKSIAGCDRAANIGGCKFTDMAAVSAQQNATYNTKLTKAGVTCNVKEYSLLGEVAAGTPNARELVEFNCPEKQWGLMAFIPTAATSTAKFEALDCFSVNARRIQGGRIKCQYVSDDVLLAQVAVMAKAAAPSVKADCVLKEVRYAGLNDADQPVVEIACVNKRGYLAAIDAKRTVLLDALPCRLASKYQQKCEIPENGTFVLP